MIKNEIVHLGEKSFNNGVQALKPTQEEVRCIRIFPYPPWRDAPLWLPYYPWRRGPFLPPYELPWTDGWAWFQSHTSHRQPEKRSALCWPVTESYGSAIGMSKSSMPLCRLS